jgi:hypothetical protein
MRAFILLACLLLPALAIPQSQEVDPLVAQLILDVSQLTERLDSAEARLTQLEKQAAPHTIKRHRPRRMRHDRARQ